MFKSLFVAALVVGAAVSGCSAAGSTVSSETAAPSRSSDATSPSPNRPVILDDDELPSLPGLKYVAEVSDEASLKAFLDASRPNDQLVGYLARGIKEGDDLVARVSILRFDTPAPPDEEAEARELIMQDFAGKPGTSGTLRGRDVQEVEGARGTDVGAVLWIDGTDVVVIASQGLESARGIADTFLKNSD